MALPILVILGAIPVALALLIGIPLLTQPEVPIIASDFSDKLELEYTKLNLTSRSNGITEQLIPIETQILQIKEDGKTTFRKISQDSTTIEKNFQLGDKDHRKLKAMIKETGFMTIPEESFPAEDDEVNFLKSSLKLNLNGNEKRISWVEQNSTSKFVPPIITMVELELDTIIKRIID